MSQRRHEHSGESSSSSGGGGKDSPTSPSDTRLLIQVEDDDQGKRSSDEYETEAELQQSDDEEDDELLLGSSTSKRNVNQVQPSQGLNIQQSREAVPSGSGPQRFRRTSSRSSINRYKVGSRHRVTSIRSRSQSFKKLHTVGSQIRNPVHIKKNQKLTERERALVARSKYYEKLSSSGNNAYRDHFLMPAHIIPPSFYSIVLLEPGQKQSSLVTIFAIGNLMIGTSSLSMPWAIQQAGLVLGVFIILFMCAFACYTCLLIVDLTFQYEKEHNGGKPADFSDVCAHFLGPVGKWAAVVCSLLCLLGAMFAYWILMSNFLYNDVTFVVDAIRPNTITHSDDYKECLCPYNSSFYYTCFRENDTDSGLGPYSSGDSSGSDTFGKVWDQTNTVPFFLLMLVAPLINFKSPTFFTKFNSMGTFSVIYIICFLVLKAASWGVNVGSVDYPTQSTMPLFGGGIQFAALSGIAMLAFFSHNACVTVLRNQKTPENNTRDVILGYLVGLTTYLCCGLIFYMCFPLSKDCIQQNLLDNFLSSDVFGFVGRIFLFFQMMAVFPLLAYVVRLQFYYSFFQLSSPSYTQIFMLNASCIVLCAIVAFLIPNIGTVTRFSGAISGAVYVSLLPALCIMQRQRARHELSHLSLFVHGSICVIGVANFIAQFFVNE